MRPILAVFRQHLFYYLRDKPSLFWFMVFPLVLMFILVPIFSGMGDPSGIRFRVGLINQSSHDAQAGIAAAIFTDVLREMAAQDESWLDLTIYERVEDSDAVLAEEMRALTNRDRHLLVVIPEDFDSEVGKAIVSHRLGAAATDGAEVLIVRRAHDQLSEAAAAVFEQMVEEMNQEILVQSGLLDREQFVVTTSSMVPVTAREAGFSYGDYVLPGILIMSFLMTGLSTIMEGLLTARDKGVLRRYLVTPLSTGQYFAGLLLWILAASLVQVLLVFAAGHYFLGISLVFWVPQAIFFLFYSLVVLVSFGFLAASVVGTADAGASLANILIYPMGFLGGLFFSIEQAPAVIQVLTRINPVTYLINGLRDALGAYPSFTSMTMNLLIPGLWLMFSVIISLRKFRWEVR